MARLWQTFRERLALRSRTQAEAQNAESGLVQDYRQTFGTEQGQRVLADLLKRAGLMQSSFSPGDPHRTAFLEGRRRLGIEVIEQINRDPDAVTLMLRAGETDALFAPEGNTP